VTPVEAEVLAKNQEVHFDTNFQNSWQLLFGDVDPKGPWNLPLVDDVAEQSEAEQGVDRTIVDRPRKTPFQNSTPFFRLFMPRPSLTLLSLELLNKWDL